MIKNFSIELIYMTILSLFIVEPEAFVAAELNAIITFLGMICAMIQFWTGFYAAYMKKKIVMLKTNPILHRAHTAFGGFSTTLYYLGLFDGFQSFVGIVFLGSPPLETNDASFNFHVWLGFPIMIVYTWKVLQSYLNKRGIYKNGKFLGIAAFICWSYTWITSISSYYLRTLPTNLQQPPPVFLLPHQFWLLQLLLPFIVGSLISIPILKRASSYQKGDRSQFGTKETIGGMILVFGTLIALSANQIGSFYWNQFGLDFNNWPALGVNRFISAIITGVSLIIIGVIIIWYKEQSESEEITDKIGKSNSQTKSQVLKANENQKIMQEEKEK